MEHEISFIDNDEFSGIELYCNRHMIAQFYLSGYGIEIGALHKPLQVPLNRCHVQYVDYKNYDENRARYPELANEPIVQTDIIDNGFVLDAVSNNSQDFIIANHALEHSPDPYGTLLNWLSKLKPGGVVYAAIPIASICYDKGRPITSLQHLADDHDFFSSIDKNAILDVTKDHIWEFLCISNKNIRESMGLEPATREHQLETCNNLMKGLEQELNAAKSYAELINAHVHHINKLYDIHYHTFTPRSYEIFLRYFTDQTRSILENVIKNGNGECIGIIRKQLVASSK